MSWDDLLIANIPAAKLFQGSSRTVETACQEALRNPLVLHHIFRSFSVKFLLHSCSLVNKPWNTEARKLTRNYRICRASKPKGTNACFSLQQFKQMCSQIKQGGRVIPFNGLKLYIGERCTVNSKGVENGLTNLSSDFELKHLSIMGCLGAVDCEIHNSVMKLLRRRAQGLSTLKIDKQILFGPGKKKWPCFSQLKELDISESFLTEDFDEEDTAKLKKLICAVLENAPNLKRILAQDVETMSIFVLAEKHNLVMPPKRFKFWLERREDIHALQAVSQNGCRLQKLIIAEPFMITTTAGFFQRGVQEPADDNLCRQFHAALEQMLKTCHRNVRRISIKGAYPLASSISLPQLDCLTIFKISKAREGNLAQLWNAIETIDYNRVMPNLKEMKIVVETVHGRWSDATRTFVPDQDGSQIWPTTGRDDHIPCSPSKSVRKLELHLELRKVNLFPLKAVFPSITSLELNVHENGKLGAEIAPFSDIWTCWPDLHKLSIYGSTVSITRNFDADFCGITEQEAEWLRRQPTRFLKKVHIVPIKPCLLTMKSKVVF